MGLTRNPMPTQHEIAEHLSLNQSEVSRHMKSLGIDWKATPMDEIRKIYILHLRSIASGHSSSEGDDLTKERILTERVDRELKELDLATKKGQLVNVDKLEPMLMQMVSAFRGELLSSVDKITDEFRALYEIEIDQELLLTHIHAALANFAQYNPSPDSANQKAV